MKHMILLLHVCEISVQWKHLCQFHLHGEVMADYFVKAARCVCQRCLGRWTSVKICNRSSLCWNTTCSSNNNFQLVQSNLTYHDIKYFSFSVIAGPSGWWWKLLRQHQRGHTGADWCQHSPQRLCVCLLFWLRAGHGPGGHEPPGRVFRRSWTHHGHFA